MTKPNVPFDQRIKQIERKRSRLAKGSVKRMTSDGLIVERPRLLAPRLPWRSLVILALVALLLKAGFVATEGTAAYQARVTALSQGGPVNQAGAWVLQVDPVTRFVADAITFYLE